MGKREYKFVIFLAETSNCVEKVKDCEDLAKKEIEKLKKTIDENEKFFRKELWQLREHTGELLEFFDFLI